MMIEAPRGEAKMDCNYLSQCCGCPVDVPCPSEPVDNIVVICPDCHEWTGVEAEDF